MGSKILIGGVGANKGVENITHGYSEEQLRKTD